MSVFGIACALPDDEHYFIFHSHFYESRCEWIVPDDAAAYFQLKQLVESLYADYDSEDISGRRKKALCPPGVTKEEALQKLVVYLVEADRRSRDTRLLRADYDNVKPIRRIGYGNEPGYLQAIVILKKAKSLVPTPRLASQLKLEKAEDGAYLKQGVPVDLDSLEWRSNPFLVEALRRQGSEILEQGMPKVLTIPGDTEVELIKTRSGEALKEKARFWS